MSDRTAVLEKELQQLNQAHGLDPHQPARRIDLINDLAWEIALSNPTRARGLVEEAREASTAQGYAKGLAFAARNLAYFHLMDTRLEEAYFLMQEARTALYGLGEEHGEATAMDILSIICRSLGRYEQALDYAHENLKFNERRGDLRGRAWAYHNLGWIHHDLKERAEAVRHYNLSLNLFREARYDVGTARVLTRLGELYEEARDLDRALECFSESQLIAEKIQMPIGLAQATKDLGRMHRLRGEPKQARESFEQCLRMGGHSNKDLLAQVHVDLAELELSEGGLSEARDQLERALSQIDDTNARPTQIRIHRLLADVLELEGNFEEALQNWKRFHELKELVFNEEVNQRVRNIEIRVRVERAEQETEIERLKNVELARERERSEALLRNILPDSVAEELKEHGRARPRLFHSATVLFTDFVGFTRIAEQLSPEEVIAELDKCFSYFDSVTTRYGLEKLKTIGDAFMCAGGIPEPNGTHAVDCALAAIEIRDFMMQMKRIKEEQGFPYWELRIGMASGPLIAGVVGEKKFAYDVWGDTVNTASRMESAGEMGRVNLSGTTHALIDAFFECEPRGRVAVKNKEPVDMFFLSGLRADLSEGGRGRVPNEAFRARYAALAQI